MSDLKFIPAPPLVIQKEHLNENNVAGPGMLKIDKQGSLSSEVYKFRGSVQILIDNYNSFIRNVGRVLGSQSLTLANGDRIVFENPKFVRPFRTQDINDVTVITPDNIEAMANSSKPLLPYHARLEDLNYSAHLYATARLIPYDKSKSGETQNLILGRIPAMLGSSVCHLENKTITEIQNMGECPNDPFGYFIMKGGEKLLIGQQRLRNQVIVTIPDPKTKYMTCQMIVPTFNGTERIKLVKDMKTGVYKVHLSSFGADNDINALYIFKMFGIDEEQSIFSYFEPFIPNRYLDRFINEISTTFTHMEQFPDPFELLLKAKSKQNTPEEQENIFQSTFRSLFPQYNSEIENLKVRTDELYAEIGKIAADLILKIEEGSLYNYLNLIQTIDENEFIDLQRREANQLRDIISETDIDDEGLLNRIELYNQINDKIDTLQEYKLYMLGNMLVNLALVNMGIRKPTDRDDWGNKTIVTAGHKFAELFLQIWRTTINAIQTKEINKNPRLVFTTAIRGLSGVFTKPFEDSMISGKWGFGPFTRAPEGIVATPTRNSIVSLVSDLTKINTPSSREGSNIKKREMHPSQFGFVCPAETPEGQNCGMLEVMATMALISLDRDESVILEYISSNRFISLVRTNEMNRPFFINGRIEGWCDPATTYKFMIQSRRSGRLDYDVTVLIDDGIYVNTNSGRLIRPLLRINPDYRNGSKILIDTLKDGWNQRPEFLISQGYIEYIEPRELRQTEIYEGRLSATIIIAQTLEALEQRETERLKILSDFDKVTLEFNLAKENLEQNPADTDLQEQVKSLYDKLQIYQSSLESVLKNKPFTHVELDPSGILGRSAILSPASEHNAAPRAAFQCKMTSQGMAMYSSMATERFDTTGKILAYPSQPIFSTQGDAYFRTGANPSGHNVILAIGIYGGYNQEDSYIVNGDSIDLGLFWMIKLTEFSSKITTTDSRVLREKFTNQIPYRDNMKEKYHAIQQDGTPRLGAFIRPGDCIIGKIQTNTNNPNEVKNVSEFAPTGVSGYVHRVYTKRDIVKVYLKQVRRPVKGQKLAIRAAQKGTIGQILPGVFMPFDEETGVVPTIIANPHSFPKRMTMSVMLEVFASAAGVLSGQRVNATAFRGFDVNKYAQIFQARGFRSTGKARMISGIDGTEMTYEIFEGVCQVQTLKHQVEDKINARNNGPINPITRQPTRGKPEGGLKFGEMEKDAVVAWGANSIIIDRMAKCSDAYTTVLCQGCGGSATPHPREGIFECKTCGTSVSLGTCTIPYTLTYLRNLTAAAWMKITIGLTNNEKERVGSGDLEQVKTRIETVREESSQILVEGVVENLPRQTSQFLTRYEEIRILGIRAEQLSKNFPPLIPITDETDAIEIARKELAAGVLPFIVRRRLPNGLYENIPLSELKRL